MYLGIILTLGQVKWYGTVLGDESFWYSLKYSKHVKTYLFLLKLFHFYKQEETANHTQSSVKLLKELLLRTQKLYIRNQKELKLFQAFEIHPVHFLLVPSSHVTMVSWVKNVCSQNLSTLMSIERELYAGQFLPWIIFAQFWVIDLQGMHRWSWYKKWTCFSRKNCRKSFQRQELTKYLRLTLVFMWKSARWEKFNLYFLRSCC